jgi:hypothetical protein
MAYTTGTVNSISDVIALAISLATTCGWIDYGGGVIGKDGEYLQINTLDANTLRIKGALSSSMAVNPTSHFARLRVTVWPATYHAFVSTTPTDMVWIEINENVTNWLFLAFGHVRKFGSWTGGAWFSATHHEINYAVCASLGSSFVNGSLAILGCGRSDSTSGSPGAPFLHTNTTNLSQGTPNTFLHCEIDGAVWVRNWSSDTIYIASAADANDKIRSMPAVSVWNGQTVLQPMNVLLGRSSNMCSIVGDVPHARWTRCTMLSDGAEVLLGSDIWKVFPFYKKNAATPDGGFNVSHTGTAAIALRKNMT